MEEVSTKMRSVVIIPENGEVFERKIEMSERHASGMKYYCEMMGIPLDFPLGAPYLWGAELAKQNHICIQIENRMMILFLPYEITDNQVEWFQTYRNYIAKHRIYLLTIEQGEKQEEKMHESTDEFGEPVNMVSLLYKELKKRSSRNKGKRK